ncbi:MAG: M3 family oligoendopeptidase [Syntrophobacteraceae bacterium]|nr:M3 family oligoendopeptidase [Syntrophobacteraceae bacterium]
MENYNAEEIFWDLKDLYSSPSDPKIASDLQCLKERLVDFFRFRGKIVDLEPDRMVVAVEMLEEINERAEKLLAYAYLDFSTRTLDAGASAFFQSMKELYSQIKRDTLFFSLEWTNLAEGRAEALAGSSSLSKYGHYLTSLRRYKPHVLSEPEEKILAEKSPAGSSAWGALFDKMVASLRFGEKARTQSEVLGALHSAERKERKQAADELSEGLQGVLVPLTHIFNTLLLDKSIEDRLRGYPHWLGARNLDNEIGDAMVDALVSAVCSRYDIVERYYILKRKLLGVGELFDYDRYAPVRAGADAGISWAEAREIVLTSFEEFSLEAAMIARLFFENEWIHASILPGKRSGAYSHPVVPSAHPYVLLNFTGSRRDVMTLAHELGHGIHQYLARKEGLFNSQTPLTTAESASVFAETLVFRTLLKRAASKEERLSLLCSKIEDTFATVFRQVAMNRFEERVHNARRTLGELDSEYIGEAWMQTQATMFGSSVRLLDHYKIWWSYVPHFVHSPGYVYAYAYGELLTAALYDKYLREGPGFVAAYLQFLGAGGKAQPCELLKPLGVDPTDSGFWERGIGIIEGLVVEAEKESSL